MNKQRLYWLLQISGWTIYAGINVLGVSAQSSHFTPVMAVPVVAEAFFFFLITHYYRHLGKKKGWLYQSTNRLVPKVLVSIFFMAVLVYLLRVGVSVVLHLYSPEMLHWVNLLGNITANIIVLVIWSSIYFAFHYFEKNTQSLKYEVAMNEMKLNQLKSQVNPHFIFNALNSIRALVDEEPAKAKKAINNLSNILRSSLVMDKKKLTSLKEELATTRDYLALESIRFEERLQTEFDIQPGTENVQVPPMMVQTLVENGIKHGISRLKEGGKVSVKARLNNHAMLLEIRNSGQYNQHGSLNGTGQGLRNTRQRLQLIFGKAARLEIQNENEHTVLTTVRVPLYENGKL